MMNHIFIQKILKALKVSHSDKILPNQTYGK